MAILPPMPQLKPVLWSVAFVLGVLVVLEVARARGFDPVARVARLFNPSTPAAPSATGAIDSAAASAS